MKQDLEMFSLIESYLNGTLNEEEKTKFETELSQNTELQHKVEVSRLANLALLRNKLWQVKNLSATIDKEEKKASRTKRIVAVATGLTLLVAGVTYLMVSNKEQATKIQPDTKTQTIKIKQAVSSKQPELVEVSASNQTKNISATPAKTKVEHTTKESPTSLVPTITENKAIEPISQTSNTPTNPAQTTAFEKQTETKKTEDACATKTIDAYVVTEKACLNEHNGRIQVSGFKGGQAPYHFKVLDEAKQAIAATRLAAGNYTIVITDHHHCVKTIENVMVKEEDCQKDFELNASNGEIVELGITSQSTSFSVYDKAGNLYFYKEFAEGDKIHWNGASTNGNVESGYFIFMIKYQDGKVKQGSVTVVK